MRQEYRIHPGIGVARIGDSPDRYFVGPESPGLTPAPEEPDATPSSNPTYKDANGRVKRQGARFRVYEYTFDDSGALTQVREVTAPAAQIEWRVRLVNRKAAALEFPNGPARRNEGVPEDQLVIDAGEQKVQGTSQPRKRLEGSFQGQPVPLGDLLTDSAGRLIVLGGFGKSFSVPAGKPLPSFVNNDFWCDDSSDGPVRATVRINGATHEAEPAWVIVAPPDFAPAIENAITLYDVAYDVMVQLNPTLEPADRPVSFTADIYPLLRRVSNLHWVSDVADSGHGPDAGGHFLTPAQFDRLRDNSASPTSPAGRRRRTVFNRLRKPGGGGGDMPRLPGGDMPVTVTRVQYRLLERWASGDFKADWPGQAPRPVPFDQIPVEQQPAALDRAALDACVGGGFFPGIECGRVMREPTTFQPGRLFRVAVSMPAGGLTARMAVPWQADFRDCDSEGSGDWWPGQRPVEVFRGDDRGRWVPSAWEHEDMVQRWSKLGFVVRDDSSGAERYVEKERDPSV